MCCVSFPTTALQSVAATSVWNHSQIWERGRNQVPPQIVFRLFLRCQRCAGEVGASLLYLHTNCTFLSRAFSVLSLSLLARLSWETDRSPSDLFLCSGSAATSTSIFQNDASTIIGALSHHSPDTPSAARRQHTDGIQLNELGLVSEGKARLDQSVDLTVTIPSLDAVSTWPF